MRRAIAALTLVAACAPRALPAPPGVLPAPSPATSQPWRFDVTVGEGGRELSVDAVIAAGEGAELGVEGGGSFVSGAVVSTGGPFQPLVAGRDAEGQALFRLPACPPGGCRVRYRFDLAEAARRTGDLGCAVEAGGAYLTSPSAWLLHPADGESEQRFELHVTTRPGTTFVSGLLPAGPGAFALPPAAYAADVADLPNPAWAAIGPLRVFRVEVAGEALDVAVAPGALAAGDDALRAWVEGAARAVRGYYGRAPLRRVQIVVVPGHGRGIGYARVLGNGGATVVVPLGEGTAPAELLGGWELIHELLHTSFPKLPREQGWLEEGMATYVEPLLRARLGIVAPEEVFAQFFARMPLGQPRAGEGGLDQTRSWGRTYWGGALFCLLADVAIRERTGGRRSLDDALRAVLAQGGNVAVRWELDRTLAVLDEGATVPVLRALHARLGGAPVVVDLDGLWKRLGVVPRDGGVTFDDAAPLAWVRKAMVARPGA